MRKILIFLFSIFHFCATYPKFPYPSSFYDFPNSKIKLQLKFSEGALTRIYDSDPYSILSIEKIKKDLIGENEFKTIMIKFLKDRNCEIVENGFDLKVFIQLELLTIVPREENSVSYIVIYYKVSSKDEKDLLEKWYYFKGEYPFTDYNSLYRNKSIIVSGLLIDFMKEFEKDLYDIIKNNI